jgi:hypothetical protein
MRVVPRNPLVERTCDWPWQAETWSPLACIFDLVAPGRQFFFVQSYKVPESHQEFARVSPIVSLQGDPDIINNHPADSIGTAWLVHEMLGKSGRPDNVHMLVFRDRGDLFLVQTAKSDAVLSGDVHVDPPGYQVAPRGPPLYSM